MRVVLVVALLLVTPTLAVDYYLSSSRGSDANTGTSSSDPWQSFTPLAAVLGTLTPGSTVYFCSGDQWQYSAFRTTASGNATHPITFTHYQCNDFSNGLRPILSTGVTLPGSGWTQSDMYPALLQYNLSADSLAVSTGVQALWVDDQSYTLARTPNYLVPSIVYGQIGEFLAASNINGHVLTSNAPALDVSDNYYAGAIVHIRSVNWLYQAAKVVTSKAGQLILDGSFTLTNVSFFLQGGSTPVLADQFGEYYYDVTTHLLYVNPWNTTSKASIFGGQSVVTIAYGSSGTPVVNTGNYNVFDGLTLVKSVHGLYNTGKFPTIKNCIIKQILGVGINALQWSNRVIVTNNVIDDTTSDCISAAGANSVVSGNSVSRCGLYAGAYGSANGVTIIAGTVSNNAITEVGYAGVAPHQASVVDRNTIIGSMLTLNDGGAIYSYGTDDSHSIITNNVIENCYGNIASSWPVQIAPCIYLDENANNILVLNNTCNGAVHCVYLHTSYNHLVIGNDCQTPGLYISGEKGNHTFAGNKVATRGTNTQWQNPLVRVYEVTTPSFIGVLTMYDQIYCQLVNDGDYIFQRQTSGGTGRYDDLKSWQAAELPYQPKFESGSAFYTDCSNYKPWNPFAQSSGGSSLPTGSSLGEGTVVGAAIGCIVGVVLLVIAGFVGIRYLQAKWNGDVVDWKTLSFLKLKALSPVSSPTASPSPSLSPMSATLPIPSHSGTSVRHLTVQPSSSSSSLFAMATQSFAGFNLSIKAYNSDTLPMPSPSSASPSPQSPSYHAMPPSPLSPASPPLPLPPSLPMVSPKARVSYDSPVLPMTKPSAAVVKPAPAPAHASPALPLSRPSGGPPPVPVNPPALPHNHPPSLPSSTPSAPGASRPSTVPAHPPPQHPSH